MVNHVIILIVKYGIKWPFLIKHTQTLVSIQTKASVFKAKCFKKCTVRYSKPSFHIYFAANSIKPSLSHHSCPFWDKTYNLAALCVLCGSMNAELVVQKMINQTNAIKQMWTSSMADMKIGFMFRYLPHESVLVNTQFFSYKVKEKWP